MNNFTFTKNKDGVWELSFMRGTETVSISPIPTAILTQIESIATFVSTYSSPEKTAVDSYKAEILKIITAKGTVTKADIDALSAVKTVK